MSEQKMLADRFEANRAHLRAVAYRMLGSANEAEDAVQEAWLRLARSDAGEIGNLGGWLTTVVARVCLDMLRARKSRREEPLCPQVPEPAASGDSTEQEAEMADSVGLALLVVLQTLAPAERIAFVLRDMFDLPFDEIAPIVGRTPTAARQLASRARRRVRGAEVREPEPDTGRQRHAVEAFFAAAHHGDLDALVAVLDPDVVLRSDGGPGHRAVVHGASEVASRAMSFAHLSPHVRPAVINGVAGVVVAPNGRPVSLLAFTVAHGKIVEIVGLSDRERLRRVDFTPLTE